MTEKLTVSLFGHRTIEDAQPVEQKLYELLRIIMSGNSEVEFLVGRNGEFDLMAASVIRRLKKEIYSENVFLTLVLPLTKPPSCETTSGLLKLMMIP